MTAPVSPVSDDPQVAADVATSAAPSLPDRADAPVSEVSERFLRAVMAEIPLDRLEELHLFSPLRQGTLETGIAVLAVRVPVIMPTPTAEPIAEPVEPELPFDASAAPEDAAPEEAPTDAAAELVGAGADADVTMAAEGEPEAAAAAAAATEEPAAAADATAMAVVPDVGDDDEDVSYAEELVAEASDDERVEAEATAVDIPAPLVRPVRHTVYTARYRYVIKGPERGKWEANVKAEAEAPLVTVETVVRGVQRRAGEESEIIRYSAAQIAKILRVPFPVATVSE